MRRLYNPLFGNHAIENFLLIISAVQIVIAVVCKMFLIHEIGEIFFALAYGDLLAYVIIFLYKLCVGYSVDDESIEFRRIKKDKIYFKDINCIIFSNKVVRMGISKTVWVTLVSGETKDIVSFCENYNKKYVLTDSDIKNRLDCVRANQDSSLGKYYGFIWNQKEMHKILEVYNKDYYVAASVASVHKEFFKKICDSYKLDERKIHIIDDSLAGNFSWNQFKK